MSKPELNPRPELPADRPDLSAELDRIVAAVTERVSQQRLPASTYRL